MNPRNIALTAGFARKTRAAAIAALIGLSCGAFASAPAFAATAPDAAAATDVASRIAAHFSAVKSMTGQFVQFGPHGEQTGGTFYIVRPGKLRFNYDKPSPIQVVCDGNSIVINNKKLDTWDLYPLSKTPLRLLLADNIDLSGGKVESVEQGQDLITVVLGDKSIFGNSKITMMFDSKTYELRQWTITDAQGLDTTVMIYNVKSGVAFDPSLFAIDYRRVSQSTGNDVHR